MGTEVTQVLQGRFRTNDGNVSTFEETFMGAMRTHNPRMTLKVHMLIHHVPEYVRRTAAPLGPTSEQALESQHLFFDIFLPQIQSFVLHLPYFTWLGQLGVDKSSKRL